jgi:hypothetical protein
MLRQNLLLLISATIASVLLAEALLRLVLPAPIVQKVPQEFYDYDAVIGHQLRPGQSSFTHDKPVTTNAAGCRDREYPASRGNQSNLITICLYGSLPTAASAEYFLR